MFEFTVPDLLVAAAAGTYVLGYLTINQVVLRLFVLAGTLFYIGYYATAADTPLWFAIWTSVALLIANLIGLFFLLAGRSRLSLPQRYADLYDHSDHFRALTPGDFRLLMKEAERKTLQEPLIASNEDHPTDKLYYLVSGGAQVQKMNMEFRLPPGVFIGEVAYLLNRNSSATTQIDSGSDVLVWDFQRLRARSARKSRFKLSLEAVVSRDLARKVAKAVAPDAAAVTARLSCLEAAHSVSADSVSQFTKDPV